MDSEESSTTLPDYSNSIWKHTQSYILIWASGIGFFINLVALYIIGKKRQLQKTNYYLINLIICNILLLLLNFIKKLYIDILHRTHTQCKTFLYSQQVIYSVIVLNLLALTVQWFISTCQSDHPAQFLERKKVPCVMFVVIWLFSLICALPFSYYNVLNVAKFLGTNISKCQQQLPKYILGVWSMIFFVTPMILILILYVQIMKNIRESINAAGYSTNRDAVYVHLKQIEWRKKAVTCTFMAVATLFVCEFPKNLYYYLVAWNVIKVTDAPWLSFYLATFYIYTIVSAILFMITSMQANMLSRLEFNEKLETQPPLENQSLTMIEENSRF